MAWLPPTCTLTPGGAGGEVPPSPALPTGHWSARHIDLGTFREHLPGPLGPGLYAPNSSSAQTLKSLLPGTLRRVPWSPCLAARKHPAIPGSVTMFPTSAEVCVLCPGWGNTMGSLACASRPPLHGGKGDSHLQEVEQESSHGGVSGEAVESVTYVIICDGSLEV